MNRLEHYRNLGFSMIISGIVVATFFGRNAPSYDLFGIGVDVIILIMCCILVILGGVALAIAIFLTPVE